MLLRGYLRWPAGFNRKTMKHQLQFRHPENKMLTQAIEAYLADLFHMFYVFIWYQEFSENLVFEIELGGFGTGKIHQDMFHPIM